ncbi:unnamed protein product [Amaranthus hypochondriacus]
MKGKKQKGKCFECDYMENNEKKRYLIMVNVLGSAGALRFIVNEENTVNSVILTALKLYAKQARLPALGSDSTKFLLYCANHGSDALKAWDEIGWCGARMFVLCRKPEHQPNMTDYISPTKRSAHNWKSWLNKSLSFNIN